MTRQRVFHWLRVLASLALLAVCLHLVDFGELGNSFRSIDLGMFTIAFVLNALGTVVVRAWVAHLAVGASGIRLGPWQLLRVNFIARFYTLVLPRGAAAAVRWKHYTEGGHGVAASALLLFETLVSLLTLFATAAVIMTLERESLGPVGNALLPAAWLLLAATAVLLLPFVHAGSARLVERASGRLLGRESRLGRLAGRLLEAASAYQSIPNRTALAIVLVSLLGYVFFVLSAWVLMQAMGLSVTLAAIAWIRSVTLLLALIPISVAGIGVRETSFIALLGEYGVSASQAFAFSMLTFAIQLLLGAIGAALEISRALRRTGRPAEPPSRIQP